MTTSMNISLPEALKRFAKERAERAGFSNPSDYVRDLIRQDRKRAEKEKLDQMLLEGLASGGATPLEAEEWGSIREDVLARVVELKAAKS